MREREVGRWTLDAHHGSRFHHGRSESAIDIRD
jgi:hypothetical protein